jgi:mRNA-degrading endonuclease RelE of RelBE toxin-antitoxin system
MYEVRFSSGVEKDLRKTKVRDRNVILEAVRKQLGWEPIVETRNRKLLFGLTPPFEAVPPIWELRVGDHRVFYDVDEENRIVYVRAVRKKVPHKTTEDIL